MLHLSKSDSGAVFSVFCGTPWWCRGVRRTREEVQFEGSRGRRARRGAWLYRDGQVLSVLLLRDSRLVQGFLREVMTVFAARVESRRSWGAPMVEFPRTDVILRDRKLPVLPRRPEDSGELSVRVSG